MNKLTDETVQQLIDFVHNEPGLYDKRHPNFKKSEWKAKIWSEIANSLDADEKDCRVAWRSLRDQFIKCFRELNNKGTGKAADDTRKKYKNYERLLFLKESVEATRDSYNKYEVIEEDYTVEQITDIDFVAWESTEKSIHESAFSANSETSEKSIDVQSVSTCTAKKRKLDDVGESFLDSLATKISPKEPDNVELFFKSVAKTVQSYSLSHTELATLQCDVLVYVTERLNDIESKRSGFQI